MLLLTAARHADAPSWGADGRTAYTQAGPCGIDIAWGNGSHRHRLTRAC